jgi:hypothetical protein
MYVPKYVLSLTLQQGLQLRHSSHRSLLLHNWLLLPLLLLARPRVHLTLSLLLLLLLLCR